MSNAIVSAWVALLASCAHFDPQPIVPTASLDALEARSLEDPVLREFVARHAAEAGAKPGPWGLPELTLAALFFHPDLAVARAEQKQAEAGLRQASELPNPILSVGPGYNSTSPGVSPWILTTAFDVSVELPGKRALRKEEAKLKVRAQRQQLAATAWRARSRLRQSLLAYYGAGATVSLLRAHEAVQEDLVQLLEAKRKAGESSPFEASQARLGLSQTRMALRESERNASVAEVRLAEAVGISTPALRAATLNFAAFEADCPAVNQSQARRRALTNRADILAALSDYAAAEAALHLEILNQYPDLNLGPGYELDQTDNKWSLGLSVELPVLNQHQGRIAEARASRELAAAKFLRVQSAALAQIDEAVANLQGAREKTLSARKILEEVRKAYQTVEEMKEAGEVEKTEILQRKLEADAAQMALLDARLGEQEAVGGLEDALQMPAVLPNLEGED